VDWVETRGSSCEHGNEPSEGDLLTSWLTTSFGFRSTWNFMPCLLLNIYHVWKNSEAIYLRAKYGYRRPSSTYICGLANPKIIPNWMYFSSIQNYHCEVRYIAERHRTFGILSDPLSASERLVSKDRTKVLTRVTVKWEVRIPCLHSAIQKF
jgi:hypothetical protein